MAGTGSTLSRRYWLAGSAAATLWAGAGGRLGAASEAASDAPIMRPIPATGERIPAIGMGTWITFNVGPSRELREVRRRILEVFFAQGGGVIDSSPMYGSSQDVVGWCLERLDDTEGLIAATKVWTRSVETGRAQIAEAQRLWRIKTFDVMQVHNLVAWQEHLETLREAKAEGVIRYIGVTTSHGRRHGELERIMANEPIDFVQLTYNILDREAEARLLPLAAERGIAVIVNRPFRRKQLINMLQGKALPGWIGEIGVENWPQFLLKFIIAHPAVTCAIPATSQVAHIEENMGALYGRLPDAERRRRMVDHVAEL